MNANQRKEAICSMLKKHGKIKVSELADLFSVSEMTIRRDLDNLKNAQMIERSHGWAETKYRESIESIFSEREVENLAVKQQIARSALNYLKNVDSIFIDGSTTCNELVKMLPDKRRLTVFTNSVASLQILCKMNWVNTFVIGGFLASDANTLDGDIAINIAKNVFVDAAFISCSGFSAAGFVNNGISGSYVKRIMLENSRKCYLLSDDSKYNKGGIFVLGKWDKIDTIITNKPLPSEDAKIIESHNVHIVW